MDFTFDAPLWRWKGDSPWHFVSLPNEVADEIEDAALHRGGFGSVRVSVNVGESTWATSIFPDKKHSTFLLPMKKQIRVHEALAEGDVVRVHLQIVH